MGRAPPRPLRVGGPRGGRAAERYRSARNGEPSPIPRVGLEEGLLFGLSMGGANEDPHRVPPGANLPAGGHSTGLALGEPGKSHHNRLFDPLCRAECGITPLSEIRIERIQAPENEGLWAFSGKLGSGCAPRHEGGK